MSQRRTPRWRLQRVRARELPGHPAPGLASYKRSLDGLLGDPEALPTLRASIMRDGIITPLLAIGNWSDGSIAIIDGFRRLKIAKEHELEVPLKVYDGNDLNHPADILRLRVSTHASSSATDVLSMALSIHSAWEAVAPIVRYWDLKHARIGLEDAESDVPRHESAPSTIALFDRANVSIRRFRGTLLPMVFYYTHLQRGIFDDKLKPSIAKVIYSAPRHGHFPLLEAAQQGTSRSELLQMKQRFIDEGPPPGYGA